MTKRKLFIICLTVVGLAVSACSDPDPQKPPSDSRVDSKRVLSDGKVDSQKVLLDGKVVVSDGAKTGECNYNGKVYKTGDVFCAIDGCNSCQCNPEGSIGVGCTAMNCSADGGVIVKDVCKKTN